MRRLQQFVTTSNATPSERECQVINGGQWSHLLYLSSFIAVSVGAWTEYD